VARLKGRPRTLDRLADALSITLDLRSLQRAARGTDDRDMGDRESLFDTDLASLERRVARLINDGGQVVGRFTYWYTTRAAVHEVVVARASAGSGD
jgi:hypothetical protein